MSNAVPHLLPCRMCIECERVLKDPPLVVCAQILRGGGTYAARCPECRCVGPEGEDPEVAGILWNEMNTRPEAPSTAVPEDVKALREALGEALAFIYAVYEDSFSPAVAACEAGFDALGLSWDEGIAFLDTINDEERN